MVAHGVDCALEQREDGEPRVDGRAEGGWRALK